MAINPINFAQFQPAALTSGQSAKGVGETASATGKSPFADAMRSVIDSLNTQQKGAEQEIARAVTGDTPDLHQTIIALQNADLNFQFALQVRNKFISAYEEVTRMQV